MKHSKALLVALAFCIGALVGALFVQAQTSLSIQYLMGGIYPGAPSYTVWKEGSNYLAKDAHGQIDFSGTNASDVITDTINALSTYGGLIYMKAGDYAITNTIMINDLDNIHIQGELVGTSPEANGYGTRLRATANVSIINATGATYSSMKNLRLEQLYFQGYEGTAIVTYIKYNYWTYVTNCKFRVGWSYALQFDQCEMPFVINNEFHEIGRYAISLDSCIAGFIERNNIFYISSLGVNYAGISLSASDACAITNNHISDMYGRAILLYDSQRNRLIGNYITDCSRVANNTVDCIVFDTNSSYNILNANIIRESWTFANQCRYGLSLDATSDYNVLTDNQFIEDQVFGTDWSVITSANNEVDNNRYNP